jgi:hypothetical protein
MRRICRGKKMTSADDDKKTRVGGGWPGLFSCFRKNAPPGIAG